MAFGLIVYTNAMLSAPAVNVDMDQVSSSLGGANDVPASLRSTTARTIMSVFCDVTLEGAHAYTPLE